MKSVLQFFERNVTTELMEGHDYGNYRDARHITYVTMTEDVMLILIEPKSALLVNRMPGFLLWSGLYLNQDLGLNYSLAQVPVYY